MMWRTPLIGTLLAITVAGGLAGCGETPEVRIEKMLTERNYSGAVELAQSEVEESPQHAYFNWLLLESLLHQCAANDCFVSNTPLNTASLTTPLRQLSDPLQISKEQSAPLQQKLSNLVYTLGQTTSHPHPVTALYNAAADTPSITHILSDALAQQAKTDLIRNNPAAARTQLQLLAKRERTKASGLLAGLLLGYLNDDPRVLKRNMIALRSRQEQSYPPALLEALPLVYLKYLENNSNTSPLQAFIDTFSAEIKGYKLNKLFNETARSTLARAINQMAQLPNVQQMTLSGDMPASISLTEVSLTAAVTATESVSSSFVVPEVAQLGLENPQTMIQLELAKLALSFDPAQPDVWRSLLPTLRDATAKTGDISFLTSNINPEQLPADVRGLYNQMLFDLTDQRLETKEDVLPLLEQVVIPPEGSTAVEEKRDALLSQALTDALEANNVDRVITLVQFRPEVGAIQRGALVPFLINALRDKWQQDQFEDLIPLADFLNEQLNVDFSLDSLIIQGFQEFTKSRDIAYALSATTPEVLLQPSATIALDLGPKFDYLKEYFDDRPQIIDNQLKTLIINARGLYGQSSVLWRLWNKFSEEQFPTAERHEFLINSLQNSLNQDTSLRGADVIILGQDLTYQHPDLTPLFLLNNALQRTSSLQDSRDLWEILPPQWLETLRAIRPQYVSFMEAVDAFEQNDRAKAARLLSSLTESTYLNQARPYIVGYLETLNAFGGMYLNPAPTDNNKLLLLELSPLTPLEVATDTSNTTVIDARDLLAVKLKLTSTVGENMVETPETLTTDRGKVYTYTLVGRLDPAELTIAFDDSIENQHIIRQVELHIGQLAGLKLSDVDTEHKTLDVLLANGDMAELVRIREQVNLNLFTNGIYAMTTQRTVANPDTDHILPIGSVVSLTTLRQKPVRLKAANNQRGPIVYPVEGTIKHPAAPQELPIRGFYNPSTHSVNFAYRYPLGQGDIEALVRCHAVERFIQCAGHNRHWARNRFAHVVRGEISANSPRLRFDVPIYEEKNRPDTVPAVFNSEEELLTPPETPVIFDESELDEFEAMEAL